MKKTEIEAALPLAEAIKEIQSEFPNISVGAIGEAIRNEEIPHLRSSPHPKARISLKLSDLRKYAQSLARG